MNESDSVVKSSSGDQESKTRMAELSKSETLLHVFLDMHGVLVEHGTFSRMYRESTIRLLQEMYAGPARVWRNAHNSAGKRWIEAINTAIQHPEGRTYDEIYTGLQGKWLHWVLDVAREYGMHVPRLDDAEAYRLGNDLGHRIPASFKSIPPAHVAAVRAICRPPLSEKIRLYVATNAHSQHASGVIESADLLDCFAGICTPDVLGCFYKNRTYWERAFAYAGAEAPDCLVADDEEKKGIADPHALGALTVLVNERKTRQGNPADEHDPDSHVRQSRRSLADYRIPGLSDLPALLARILEQREGRAEDVPAL